MTYRTQKAQGVSHLSGYPAWAALPAIVLTSPDETLTTIEQDIIDRWASRSGLFVRPCPVNPAHGFVESRKLSGHTLGDIHAEIAAIWQETIAADPQGELLLTPYLPSALNFIWRPGVVTIGPGHDGATSGRDSVSIPCPLPDIEKFAYDSSFRRMLETSRITEEPYVEAVMLAKGHVNPLSGSFTTNQARAPIVVTQLRNGPAGSITPDFVPTEMTVAQVVQTNGEDLLAWKARVEAFAPGTAVYHPGGNCNDHYFVHCRVNQVPILTTRPPRVGETLVPTEGTPAPYDAKACLRGIVTGLLADLSSEDERRLAVGAISHLLHSAGHIGGRDAYWLGIAAMLMTRLGYAAAIGEYRHSFRSGEWRAMTRDQVYEELLDDYFDHRDQVEQAWASFFYGRWSSSYGGPAWATCTSATMALEQAMLALITTPSPEGVAALITQLNITVNLAHNNGWWLNKFANKDVFNLSAMGEPSHLLSTSRFLYDAHQRSHTARTTWIDTLRRFRRLRPLVPYVAHKQPLHPKADPLPFTADGLLAALAAGTVQGRLIDLDGHPQFHIQAVPDVATLTTACGLTEESARQVARSHYWRIDMARESVIFTFSDTPVRLAVVQSDATMETIRATLAASPDPCAPSASGSGLPYRILAKTWTRVGGQLVGQLRLTDATHLTVRASWEQFVDYANYVEQRLETAEVPMAYTLADMEAVRQRYGLQLTGNLIMQRPTEVEDDEETNDDEE